MAQIDGSKPVILNAGFGMPLQTLLPSEGGYLALWVFDIDDENELISRLLVELSVDEARAVVSRDPYTVGFLEPVRLHLGDRVAWVIVSPFGDGETLGAVPVRIPADGDERSFAAWLEDLVEPAVSAGAVYDDGIPTVPPSVIESTHLAYAAMADAS